MPSVRLPFGAPLNSTPTISPPPAGGGDGGLPGAHGLHAPQLRQVHLMSQGFVFLLHHDLHAPGDEEGGALEEDGGEGGKSNSGEGGESDSLGDGGAPGIGDSGGEGRSGASGGDAAAAGGDEDGVGVAGGGGVVYPLTLSGLAKCVTVQH